MKKNALTGRDYTREKVRKRDNYTCQHCLLVWKKGERRFDVHHKDLDKDKTKGYDKPEEFNNLITLCHKCLLNIPGHKKKMRESSLSKEELVFLKKRKEEMVELREKGLTQKQIGDVFGISHQRVSKILSKQI